ncbi:MAG: hypothetical protein ACI9Y1_001798 [Lentisphaeria bacterium]|jgi:hypothetical protein
MNERKEPTISAVPEGKEDPLRQQRRAEGRPALGHERQKSAASSPVARPVVAKTKTSPMAVILALLVLSVAGFSFWQVTQTQKLLTLAEGRIIELEGKFELAGDETTTSAQAMQAKIVWADSEIRKLWGVSYDTNRKTIADNVSKLAAVEKMAKSAGAGVDGKIKTALRNTSADLKILNDLVDAQQASLSNIETRNAQIMKDAKVLSAKLLGLEKIDADLKRRVKTNELAIEAIDAFRRSVNQQMLQLKGVPTG